MRDVSLNLSHELKGKAGCEMDSKDGNGGLSDVNVLPRLHIRISPGNETIF